eukprot:COSAG05_NODE_131_length_17136_cov_213.547279_2_plen_34_part_00
MCCGVVDVLVGWVIERRVACGYRLNGVSPVVID